MAAKYDVVVVGAGNAGLSAAVKCAVEGKKTLLIDQHNLPGGCASSFRRGRFEFDPSVHEICDFGPDDNKGHVRLLMERNGVNVDWITVPECYRCISTYSDGTPMDVTMPCGREEYIAAMEKYVPGSRESMEKFFDLLLEIRAAKVYMNDGTPNDAKYMQKHFPNTLRSCGYDALRVMKALKIPQKAIDIINRLTSSLQVRPFDFIRRTDPAHLLNFIQQEYPQTIALILAYLEPGKAAVIMQNLPEDMQAEVSKRLATMDRTSPDVLRDVERVLEKKLSTLSSEDYTAAGGVEAIVEILNLVDRSSEKSIIESLEEDDPDLAEEIKKRMFVFEDIVMLDDRAIQKVLRDVDQQELAKALKSVDTEVQDKIFRNMSKRAASMLKEDMEFMGPVRLKDVEESQQKIVSIIRRLEDNGDIVIARSGEDELVS